MKRRELLVILGSAGVAWPLGVRAQQQAKVWRVGFLAIPERPAALGSSRYGAFARGMRELGYVEGDNLLIEYRFADGKAERLSNIVVELLELLPDALVVAGTPAVRAAQKATTRIPIVMAGASDPVGSGFVRSFVLPGGNITGVSNLVPSSWRCCSASPRSSPGLPSWSIPRIRPMPQSQRASRPPRKAST